MKKQFNVKNGQLFDGDTPVKLMMFDPDQIAFLKMANYYYANHERIPVAPNTSNQLNLF